MSTAFLILGASLTLYWVYNLTGKYSEWASLSIFAPKEDRQRVKKLEKEESLLVCFAIGSLFISGLLKIHGL